jgi:hypothetical protein
LGAAFHFIGRYVFFVRRNTPLMTERICDFSVAVAPEHVIERHVNLRAIFDGKFECCVDVVHVKVEISRDESSFGGGGGNFIGDGIGDKNCGIADSPKTFL